ncbi:DUF2283 domain-containing protein [Candidatus Pacearchaeota archaeon]|nr:DUF2283 domain-containing protein [Candidatus Pacearchaeota archaeon]
MRFTYDKEADAVYIYLGDFIEGGGVKETRELKENIFLDLDENGKLLGIEILDASKILNKELLVKAEVV